MTSNNNRVDKDKQVPYSAKVFTANRFVLFLLLSKLIVADYQTDFNIRQIKNYSLKKIILYN